MIGIYIITNKINNMSYIGQSHDIEKRWKQHKHNIGSNKNPLYKDFEEYGIENFSFNVIEECCSEKLNEREKFYIQSLNTQFPNGYNLTAGGQNKSFKLSKSSCFNSYSNRNKITIIKRKWERYLMVGIDEIREASCELSNGALKLYLYLCENVDGYVFWLSPKDVQAKYNMSKSTFDRAKAELIQKGYLSQEGRKIKFYCNKKDCNDNLEKLIEKLNTLGGRLEAENPSLFQKYYDDFEK